MGELVKNIIIKTNIGYFCKEEKNLLTVNIDRATLLNKIEANTYFKTICAGIARINNSQVSAMAVIYNGFRFEIGKYYENTDGFKVHILAAHHMTAYGKCFVAETNAEVPLIPLGMAEEATIGFHEITKERWMSDFKVVDTGKVVQ